LRREYPWMSKLTQVIQRLTKDTYNCGKTL